MINFFVIRIQGWSNSTVDARAFEIWILFLEEQLPKASWSLTLTTYVIKFSKKMWYMIPFLKFY